MGHGGPATQPPAFCFSPHCRRRAPASFPRRARSIAGRFQTRQARRPFKTTLIASTRIVLSPRSAAAWCRPACARAACAVCRPRSGRVECRPARRDRPAYPQRTGGDLWWDLDRLSGDGHTGKIGIGGPVCRTQRSGPNLGAANPSDTGFPPAVGGRPWLEASYRRSVGPIVPYLPGSSGRKWQFLMAAGNAPVSLGPFSMG